MAPLSNATTHLEFNISPTELHPIYEPKTIELKEKGKNGYGSRVNCVAVDNLDDESRTSLDKFTLFVTSTKRISSKGSVTQRNAGFLSPQCFQRRSEAPCVMYRNTPVSCRTCSSSPANHISLKRLNRAADRARRCNTKERTVATPHPLHYDPLNPHLEQPGRYWP